MAMNKSAIEIQKNLDKVIKNLGSDRAATFLETVLQILGNAVDDLLLSIKEKNLALCRQYAHKLKGSSSLYGSQMLLEILMHIEKTPELIMDNTSKYNALVREFELVILQIKIRISELDKLGLKMT